MKFFSILIIISFFLSCNRISEKSVSINKIKESYNVNDTLVFNVKNNENKLIYTIVGIENLFKNKWYEKVNNFDRPFEKIEYVDTISKKMSKEYTFPLKKMNVLLEESSKFRIYIYYNYTIDSILNNKITSEIFHVND